MNVSNDENKKDTKMKESRICEFFPSVTHNGCDRRHHDLIKNNFEKGSLEKHTLQCKSFRRSGILGRSNCKCWCHDRSKDCYKKAAADEQRGSRVFSSSAADKNTKITDY
jgi:hypothetical protein